jgi:hypothetical protein
VQEFQHLKIQFKFSGLYKIQKTSNTDKMISEFEKEKDKIGSNERLGICYIT